METQASIDARAERLRDALKAAYGVRAKTLDKALSRTGRRMPKRFHKAARVIVDAQGLGGHPKQLRQLDGAALSSAEARVLEHLKSIDRADVRKGKLLGLAGVVVFNLLLIFAVFVLWLWWTGVV